MMAPLAVRTYLLRNKRRLLPMVIILSFVVLVSIDVNSTLSGLKEGAVMYSEFYRHLSLAMPKHESSLRSEQIEHLAAIPTVEHVFAARTIPYKVSTVVSYFSFPLIALPEKEAAPLLERLGDHIVEGRLPTPGSNEVAVHEMFLRANHHWIGTEFGMEVDDDDWAPGRFKVVAVIGGPAPIGLASYEFMTEFYSYAPKLWERYIVIPRAGQKLAMDAALRADNDIKVYDHERITREIELSFNKLILIVNFITLLMMIVASVVVGLLNSIFFATRLDEFAILLAMGHSRLRLLGKVLLESFAIAMASWVLGLALAEVVLYGFRSSVLIPGGIWIPQFLAEPILYSSLLPVIALVFSGVTVVRRLTVLDPVQIIERRG